MYTKKLTKYRKGIKDIESKLGDRTAKAEAKLLLQTLIFHFDCFGSQQQLINAYMSTRFHWGNRRTARVLKKLAEIGVIERYRSESDNWTLFFLVKGFLNECKDRIARVSLAIIERLSRYYSVVLSINIVGKNRIGT